MRVGMVCPYSLSVPGGVQAQVMGLARELRRMGIEVRVLGPCDGPPPATFVTPLGNSLPTSANGSVAPVAPDPSCVLRTMRVMYEEQFDVLHLHEPFAPGPPMTAILLHPAPVVGTFHAAGESASYRHLKNYIKPAAANLAHRVAVSKDAAALVSAYIPGDYEILFNGVELDDYRHAQPHPTTGPTIFFCGRHEERQGLDVLLAAMADVGPIGGKDVTLWIASNGPDTDRLRSQFGGDARIEWLGRLSDEDKIARLKGADVFCAPSLHGESFGVVLIEAMAAGTCIVASALDGYRNVATDDIDALLVAPGDKHALAKAIEVALGDRALAERLVAAGAVRADEFSMTTLACRYAEIYREVAQPQEPGHRSVSAWPFMSRSARSWLAPKPRRRRLGRMLTE
ncbi:MAG: glycosyltransferase family 4 protein [Actinobacteria bacterium]|nr:glycosyltransferase family 4 protein [Actinomycetota bacterium]